MVSDYKFHLFRKHLEEEKWRPNRDLSIAVWVLHPRRGPEGPSQHQQVQAAVSLVQ